MCPERVGQPTKDCHGRIFLAPLDPAHVARVDLRGVRQGFLRQLLGLSQALHVPADYSLPAHGGISRATPATVEEL